MPLTAYGVKAMSMGFLVPQDSPIAWRGLMVQKAMNQLLFEVAWPKLDLLVLDLPPGTGDVQLTITQSIELAGECPTVVRCHCKRSSLTGQGRSSCPHHRTSRYEMLSEELTCSERSACRFLA